MKQKEKKVYTFATIALVLGLIIGILITAATLKSAPSLIKTYCDIDMMTLYGKTCTATEDCYGRLELCSVKFKKCMTTVQVNKTDIRNIRIPDTQEECEANGGEWKVEITSQE